MHLLAEAEGIDRSDVVEAALAFVRSFHAKQISIKFLSPFRSCLLASDQSSTRPLINIIGGQLLQLPEVEPRGGGKQASKASQQCKQASKRAG